MTYGGHQTKKKNTVHSFSLSLFFGLDHHCTLCNEKHSIRTVRTARWIQIKLLLLSPFFSLSLSFFPSFCLWRLVNPMTGIKSPLINSDCTAISYFAAFKTLSLSFLARTPLHLKGGEENLQAIIVTTGEREREKSIEKREVFLLSSSFWIF